MALSKTDLGRNADDAISERVSVLAEHLARNQPTADQISQLLDVDPDSPLAIALWKGLANGWPRDFTISLSSEAQKKVRERFLSDQASVESKAAILAVADKWSIENLDEIVGKIQDELLSIAFDADLDSEKRLSAWDQAIRLAPSSPRILDAIEQLFTPQLAPETGVEAINSLQAARVDGLSDRLLELRNRLVRNSAVRS